MCGLCDSIGCDKVPMTKVSVWPQVVHGKGAQTQGLLLLLLQLSNCTLNCSFVKTNRCKGENIGVRLCLRGGLLYALSLSSRVSYVTIVGNEMEVWDFIVGSVVFFWKALLYSTIIDSWLTREQS